MIHSRCSVLGLKGKLDNVLGSSICFREKQQDFNYGIHFLETIELNSDQFSTDLPFWTKLIRRGQMGTGKACEFNWMEVKRNLLGDGVRSPAWKNQRWPDWSKPSEGPEDLSAETSDPYTGLLSGPPLLSPSIHMVLKAQRKVFSRDLHQGSTN